MDGFIWAHQCVLSTYEDVVLRGEHGLFVQEFGHRLDLLLHLGAICTIPIIVFDGRKQPVKAVANVDRAAKRQAALDLVNEALTAFNGDAAAAGSSVGEKVVKAARSVSEVFVTALINMLHGRGIAYEVAPYEADAQLAYLGITGKADFILINDGDLIVYGCPHPPHGSRSLPPSPHLEAVTLLDGRGEPAPLLHVHRAHLAQHLA